MPRSIKKYTKQRAVRLTDEQDARLIEAAAEMELEVGELIRVMIIDGLNRKEALKKRISQL